MVMPGRSHAVGGAAYRYGMNGQEKENEVFDAAFSAEFWMYDSRLGRRWEDDPLSKEWQSPYATFDNNPIYYSDPLGLESEDGGGDDKNKGGGDNSNKEGDKNKDKSKDEAKQKELDEMNRQCGRPDCYFINEKGEFQYNNNPGSNNGGTTGSNPNDQQGTKQEGGASTNSGGGNSGETSSGSPTKKSSVDGYFLGSARSAWKRGNYSDWFGYRLKHFLGEDFDKRSEKYTRPYAEFIADLNPLLNASNIINGLTSGNSIYGNKMTKTDYVFSALGSFGFGEIKSIKIFQSHHVIPNQIYKEFKPLLKKIGWMQNSKFNFKLLEKGFHGNHPQYNIFVRKRFEVIKNLDNPTEIYEAIRTLSWDLRMNIRKAKQAYKASGGKINLNEYFRELNNIK